MEFRQLVPRALLHRSFKLDTRGAFADPALILQLRNDARKVAALGIDRHVDAVVFDQIGRFLIRGALAHDLEIELLFNHLVVLLDDKVRLSGTDDDLLIRSSSRKRDREGPSRNDEAYGRLLIHDSSSLPTRSPATPRHRLSRARARAECSSAAR